MFAPSLTRLAVGFEGMFGASITLTAQILLHFLYGRTKDGRGGYFDMATGWRQMIHSAPVLWSSLAIALSIAFFNFFGLSVTRSVSATARSTIDTCRTIGIWIASLVLGWEVFRPLSGSMQILGFVLLCYGTLVFNAIIKPPRFLRPRRPRYPRHHSRSGRSRSRSRSRSAVRASYASLPQTPATEHGPLDATSSAVDPHP